jgi:hypothetical protein
MAARSSSILAVDFGSVLTRAVLIDLVDGVYRMVARGETRTTGGYPVSDVSVGLDRLLRELNESTGRKFIGDDGKVITPEQPDRSGVDDFLATVSIGRPLRTVLVGLVPEVSIASGFRAASRTYVQVVETISLYDGRSEEERLNALILSRPDLIFITGGTDKGAQDAVLEMAKVVKLAVTLTDRQHKPLILFAGNNALAEKIKDLFEELTNVLIAPNVRPSLDQELLGLTQLQLNKAFDEYKAQREEAFKHIGEMSRAGVLPSAQSYTLIADYLGKTQTDKNVIIMDVGSAVSTLAMSIGGETSSSIRTDIGLGHSAYTLVQATGIEAVRRWLPFNASATEIVNYALNKTLRPATIPMNLRDLYLEHGLLRAGIGAMMQALGMEQSISANGTGAASAFGTMIGAGAGLTHSGHPGYNALLMLDAVQPTGVTTLQADPFGLLSALGALALVNPEATVQLLDTPNLERLGTSISISGTPRVGRPALRIKIVIDREKFQQDIDGGHLWVLPLGTSKKVEVDIRVLGRGLSVGGKRRLKITLEGGSAGLIFDARGRPLPLAKDARGRATQLPLWVSEVTGDPIQTIDESWLADVGKEKEAPTEPVVADQRKPAKAAKPAKPRSAPRERGKPAREVEPIEEPGEEDFSELLEEKPKTEDEFKDLRGGLLP